MTSFDVVSMFTCVPTDLAVQVARRRLENYASLLEHDIVDLLTLCLSILQGKGLPAGTWNRDGVPIVCGCCQLGDGGCGRESLGELP